MQGRKSGGSWRAILIAVIVIAAGVFIINRISWANWNNKCRKKVSEYMASGNYASAIVEIESEPQAFKDNALLKECVEGLVEQGTAIASGQKFKDRSLSLTSLWTINEIKELYQKYGGDTAVFDGFEYAQHIAEAAHLLEIGRPGNAGSELLKLPETDEYASDRAFGQACNVLASVLNSCNSEASKGYRTEAGKLKRIIDEIPDAAIFSNMLIALDSGEFERAWNFACEIPFDGTRMHPIPDGNWSHIFQYALKGRTKNAVLTPAMLKLSRELLKPAEHKSFSSILDNSFTHRGKLKVANLDDAGKTPAGKVLILDHENNVQLEMMTLLSDAYYPESIEEVSTIISWQSGTDTKGYYGSKTYVKATQEWFKIIIENTELGTKTEEVLWADPVPEAIAEGSSGYDSKLKTKDKEALLADYLKPYHEAGK